MLQRARRALAHVATQTPLRRCAEPVYRGLVRVETWLGAKQGPESMHFPSDLTVLIKTFERPYACARLLGSLEARYAAPRVIVVDDGREPRDWPRTTTVRMPYDVGVSAGRNEGLRRVGTELVALLDDDYIASPATDFERAARFLRAHPEVDIYGGQVINFPFFERDVRAYNRDYFGGARRSIGGLPVYDRIACFFVARAQSVRDVGFDPKLKLVEHTEFFWRARKRLVTVFDERFRIWHAKTPFDRAYMEKRLDYEQYLPYLEERMRA